MGRAIAPVNSRQGARGHYYSITSSARAIRTGGIVKPSAFDLEVDNPLELRRLLDREIGRWAPFKTLATKPAARRYMSG